MLTCLVLFISIGLKYTLYILYIIVLGHLCIPQYFVCSSVRFRTVLYSSLDLSIDFSF
jgi:hypothetical protein